MYNVNPKWLYVDILKRGFGLHRKSWVGPLYYGKQGCWVMAGEYWLMEDGELADLLRFLCRYSRV